MTWEPTSPPCATIVDELPGGPARGGDAPPKVANSFVGYVDPERTDFSFVGHASLPFLVGLLKIDGRATTPVTRFCGTWFGTVMSCRGPAGQGLMTPSVQGSFCFLAGKDGQEEQKHVQDVEEDGRGQNRRGV